MTHADFLLNLLKLRSHLRQHDRWDRRQMEAHQQRSLRLLRDYAYARSPFYRKFHKGLFHRPLHELPVLTKSMVMEHFDELVTDRSIHLADVEAHVAGLRGDERFHGHYWVNSTSGSTGHRGFFIFDPKEWATLIAVFGRANIWAGFEMGLLRRKKMAVIASTTPWHMSARISATIRSWWFRVIRLDAGERTASLVERLDAWQPKLLGVYPSSLRVIAAEQLAGRLHIHPDAILTGAEVLTEETRQFVFRAWGREVFDQYGATETGNVAAECSHHKGLHMSEDMLIVEVVDEKNRSVPAGTYGDKMLVTVLFNRTQPLIRYELSDMVRLAPVPCTCGRPYRLIDRVQGRSVDMLAFPAASGGLVTVHPVVFDRVLDRLPAAGWQVLQEADGLVVLLSGVREGFRDETVVEALGRELTAQGAVAPPVKVQRVSEIPRGITGKAPLIKGLKRNTP